MPSYEKSKASGLWSCRFRETDPVTGNARQRRLSGYKTKKDAQYGYEDYIKARDDQIAKELEEQNKPPADPNEMLFDDLLREYMAFEKKRIKESSFYDLSSKIRNRLEPYFSGKRMNEITPKMLSDWIEGIDYSHKSKTWIFSTMSAIYRYGSRYYDITDIMHKVDRPRDTSPAKEMSIWSPLDFQKFIVEVDDEAYRLYFTFLYVSGCRRGEALALTWDDISERSVRINKSVTTKTSTGPYLVTTPKNKGSVRKITVPEFITDQLAAYQSSQKAAFGEKWDSSMFVFGGDRPLPPTSADRAFKSAIARAKVKHIRIHDLRHSCASLLISKGISIVAVSRQLGHSNVEQTLNTYSHMMPDDTTMIYNALDTLGTFLGT